MKIDALVKPLFEAMERRTDAADMERMREAYRFARRAHEGQLRKTGEPYITHPIAVARVVGEELGMGPDAVCAAFLHDVLEDTPTAPEEIERRFGPDVAFLVKVLTKRKGAVPLEGADASAQVDNFRQMLSSLHYDIRALLIKLGDRLHNMRTLASMAPDKQMKIAGETDFFYAPLANRLGLYRVKIELENLSFRYRCPREYARLEELLAADRQANLPVLNAFMDGICKRLSQGGVSAYVEVDYRQPFSVRRKMTKSGSDFAHVEGRHFVRVVFTPVPGESEKDTALRIYSMLTDVCKEKPGSVLNYIDSPKENGYQSLHVKLLAANGEWQEVHISSERMRLISRCGCLAGVDGQTSIPEWIERFRQALSDIDGGKSGLDYMRGVVSKFYNDDIMVFTPEGRGVRLPQKATALDFAFSEDPQKGLHAQYARVNGALCSVKTRLHRGDCVEIGHCETVTARRDWLEHVCTYDALSALNAWLLDTPEPALRRCDVCRPLPGDEVVGYKLPEGSAAETVTMVHKRDCPEMISCASQHGDRVVAVDFVPEEGRLYPVTLHIRAIDRYHLLCDLIDCITNRLSLSIDSLQTDTVDQIVDCTIHFAVHSYGELQTVVETLNAIGGVDEVRQSV